MMRITSKYSLLIFLAIAISLGFEGCKSKKNVARQVAATEYAQKVKKAKRDLQAILNDDGRMSIEEKEKILNKTKALNLNEPEVLMMIREAEDMIAKEKAEAERKRIEKDKEAASKIKLSNSEMLDLYFNQIASASSVELANQKIIDVLQMFASSGIPVLIIISQEGGITDYDKPTTIDKYLNYLKDQKKNINAIENIGYDNNGKIIELELIKK